MKDHKEEDSELIERISNGSKEFYSAGSSFSTLACAAVVLTAWGTASREWPPLHNEIVGLVFSFIIVLGYALVIPEPRGYPNAGKMRLTIGEIIFGLLNTLIVFSSVLGLKSLAQTLTSGSTS